MLNLIQHLCDKIPNQVRDDDSSLKINSSVKNNFKEKYSVRNLNQ